MTENKYYLFTSKHNPPGQYNEIHPCNITQTKWGESGWYLNSYYRLSRFKGYRIYNVSFGLVSGYLDYKVPYMLIHNEKGFYAPVFLIGWIIGYKIKSITCEFKDHTFGGSKLWKVFAKRLNKKVYDESI